MTTDPNVNAPAAGSNGVALVLAWAFVGVPLLWGVWLTLSNAIKLFQ